MTYYGTRLSENISRREPEGYLLCLNVPVARTGFQEYLPEELNLPPDPSGGLVSVWRPEEEVFSPETVASFEGMPVTNDHPPGGVDAENIRRLQSGHAHNVRRGTGAESDLLLADLIITDPCLADTVLAGKREISCGYTYELCEENNRYVQRKSRGNHIAVVDAGRAGSRVSIKDRKCERSKRNMKKSLSKALARLARDGETEAVAEFIEEMIEGSPEGTAAEGPVTAEVPENRENTVDEEFCAGLLQRLDQLISLLAAGLPSAAPAEDEDPAEEISEIVEEVLETAGTETETAAPAEEIAEIVEEILDPAASVTLEEAAEDEGEEPDPAEAKDALRAALLTFRPVLKRMSPRDRRKACADIAARMRRTRRAGDGRIYAALASARRPAPNLADLGRRIMASRNVNYKK